MEFYRKKSSFCSISFVFVKYILSIHEGVFGGDFRGVFVAYKHKSNRENAGKRFPAKNTEQIDYSVAIFHKDDGIAGNNLFINNV